MNKQIFLKWLKINSLCFIGAFIVTFLIVQLFTNIMLEFWGGWASLIEMTGAKGAAEFSPDSNTFIRILCRNSISVSIVFIVGLSLAAPIVMMIYGLFYSLVASLAPLTIGKTFTFCDWILVATEALFFIVSATFASTLATEIFGVKPEIKHWLEYWKKQLTDWKDPWAFPEQKRNWRIVFKENKKEFILFIIIILALLLFGAWFEIWGY
jgi:uncharacterized membrane protein YecN with MAPEG domain